MVKNKLTKATGEHFNQEGHKVSDMTVLEKIFISDPAVRKEREKYFIAKMNTKYKGLNKITWNCQLQHFFKKYFCFHLGLEKPKYLQSFIILSQSDDEFLNNSKYITDQNFLDKNFLQSGNLFFLWHTCYMPMTSYLLLLADTCCLLLLTTCC